MPQALAPPRVSILTATIPGREGQLRECRASVQAQTEPCLHWVRLDRTGRGEAAIRNQLLEIVSTEYVGFLDDDDVLDPEHARALVELLDATGSDLAWPLCRGFNVRVPPGSGRVDYDRLRHGGRNWIPVTVLARTASIKAVGGFRDVRYDDYDLWCRMLDAGQHFEHYPAATWEYRRTEGHRHRDPAWKPPS